MRCGWRYTSGTGTTKQQYSQYESKGRHTSYTLHTNVNLVYNTFRQSFPYPLRQLDAHILSAAVHGDAIHDGVGPGEVDVFEDVGAVGPLLNDLAEERRAPLLDKDGFARLDVTDIAEAELA